MADIQANGYIKQNFTIETGEQDMIIVDQNHRVTILVKTGAGDAVEVDAQLASSGEKAKVADVGASVTYIKSFTGPINRLGLNIVTNTSNAISLEVLSSGLA